MGFLEKGSGVSFRRSLKLDLLLIFAVSAPLDFNFALI